MKFLIAIIILAIIAIILFYAYHNGLLHTSPPLVGGPREFCEDIVCSECGDSPDQQSYAQCKRNCFRTKRLEIEECCANNCMTLPGLFQNECLEACSTQLFD